eukprot:CAMPEP_0168740578 /NCGR_PEP_ID=MMETSP0724-20121128/12060_1 /TAXON_ID=265536 /ORGANISM="Amphiprora sp., Strain CCMP467" /LENGTH=831 /DNA_ID=CAMNT_0008788035 /DNA_START=80 /DNA_END=2575 /DNA_ORIENTATION=-
MIKPLLEHHDHPTTTTFTVVEEGCGSGDSPQQQQQPQQPQPQQQQQITLSITIDPSGFYEENDDATLQESEQPKQPQPQSTRQGQSCTARRIAAHVSTFVFLVALCTLQLAQWESGVTDTTRYGAPPQAQQQPQAQQPQAPKRDEPPPEMAKLTPTTASIRTDNDGPPPPNQPQQQQRHDDPRKEDTANRNHRAARARRALDRMQQRGAAPFPRAYDDWEPTDTLVQQIRDSTTSNSYTLSNLPLSEIVPKAFPLTWSPCTLLQQQDQDQQQDQQQHDIVATIMGGSCSAHAGAGCPFNTKANPLGGRYSNQLDYWHHKEEEAEEQQPHDDDNLFKLHIRNMGQGATTSDFNALFLDHFLDANHRRTTTAAPLPNHRNDGEFLVWEFGVNDIAGDIPTEEQVRKLDFWLKRVHSYYLQQGRRVPPIIFVHIWPYQTGRRMLAEANAISGRYNSTTLWSRRPDPQQLWPETTTPMDRVGALLREYQSQGWDIGLLDVGSVINVTQVLWMSAARHMMMDGDGDSGNNHPISFPFELFADNTHPSCMGNGLIADLLQYFLYSNVASCDADVVEEEEDSKKKKKAAEQVAAAAPQRNLRRTHHKVATDHDPQDLSVPHRKDVLGPDIDPQWKGLWTDLFHERTKVGSLTPWLPTLTMTTANQHKAKDSGWTKTSPFISSLNIVNRHEVNSWPIVQAVDPKHPDIPLPENRGDRKHSYAIPKCGRKDLKLELQEPDLKWLGLSVVEESNISEDLMIQINGQSVDPELLRRNDGLWSPMRYDHRWIKHWVNIQDASSSSSAAHDAPTSSQVIRLCHNGRDNIQLPLYHLVGVVVPKG